jgi:hypothetical protein
MCDVSDSYISKSTCPTGSRCFTLDPTKAFCFPDCKKGTDCTSSACTTDGACAFPSGDAGSFPVPDSGGSTGGAVGSGGTVGSGGVVGSGGTITGAGGLVLVGIKQNIIIQLNQPTTGIIVQRNIIQRNIIISNIAIP